MTSLSTNRDLYVFVAELAKQHAQDSITLASYLSSLEHLAFAHRQRSSLPLDLFAELLRRAFEPAPAPVFSEGGATVAFLDWRDRLRVQLLDLEALKRSGGLADPCRYFGIDAPHGGRWYNLDPCLYLRCATEGTFGGWREGDDTGRVYVPGPVAVVDASGALTLADPRDLDSPDLVLEAVTWEVFVDFLEAGQSYE